MGKHPIIGQKYINTCIQKNVLVVSKSNTHTYLLQKFL